MSIADTGLKKTAFVLAGGGSFGAIQVGMMHSLAAHGISPDMVVGSSVGAINGAYYAGDPTLKGVLQLETIWCGLRGWPKAPIIVLSGRADSVDKVEALDAGADDYVTKPFGV